MGMRRERVVVVEAICVSRQSRERVRVINSCRKRGACRWFFFVDTVAPRFLMLGVDWWFDRDLWALLFGCVRVIFLG